jgi:hypothetical protein
VGSYFDYKFTIGNRRGAIHRAHNDAHNDPPNNAYDGAQTGRDKSRPYKTSICGMGFKKYEMSVTDSEKEIEIVT